MPDLVNDPTLPPIPVNIRTYRESDAGVCSTLYVDGLIGESRIAENDTGLDIDDIAAAYLNDGAGNFWVAENAAGEVVGMIGVQQLEDGVGEIRRLRVRVDSRRRGIGTALMEAAVRHCRERGYLKITLDTFMDREAAMKLFKKFHFIHSRTRKVGEKELLYFYLDLYHSERRE